MNDCQHVLLPNAIWHWAETPWVWLILRRRWESRVQAFALANAQTYRRHALRKGLTYAWEWRDLQHDRPDLGLRAAGWHDL